MEVSSLSKTRWTHISLAILAVALLVPATTLPASAQEDEELQHHVGWDRGDHWVWEKKPAPNNPAQTEGEYKWTVTGFERVTLSLWDAEKHPPEHQKHQAYRIKVWANQTANSGVGPVRIETEQDRWIRIEDQGTARVYADNDYITLTPGGDDLGGSRRDHQYFPPELEMQFPFGEGDKWRMYINGLNWNPDSNSCGGAQGQPPCKTHTDSIETYEVLGRDTITVPAGTFDTWIIQNKHELKWDDAERPEAKRYDLIWWSPEACHFVQKQEFKSDGSLQFTHRLTDYRCSQVERPDPPYDIYAYENFSSTRFHPERGLFKSEALGELEAMAGGGGTLGGSAGAYIGEKLPGFQLSLALAALAMVGVAARRRR